MARFYVGQRVRIVKTTQHHHLLGKEANIIGLDSEARSKDGDMVRGFELDVRGPNGHNIVCHTWQIEPLTDCYDTTTWGPVRMASRAHED